MAEKRHVQYLDVLKGVTIFLVVVGHAFHFGFSYYDSPLLYVLRSIDMPIFLLLSGMLASGSLDYTLGGVKDYWLKKTRQLLLPLSILPFIYAILYNIDIKHLVFDRMHGGYWFTLCLFEMFVLLYGVRYIDKVFNKSKSIYVEVLLLLISLAFVLLIDEPWRLAHRISWEALSWGKTNYLYYYFIFGYILGKYPHVEGLFTTSKVQLISACVFLVCIYSEIKGTKIGYGIPASFSGAIMAYSTAKILGEGSSKINVLLASIGRESRTIYLTHYLLLCSAPMVGSFLKNLRQSSDRIFLWEVLLGSVYAITVISATLLLVKLFRSNPYLNTLFYGKPLSRIHGSQAYVTRKN